MESESPSGTRGQDLREIFCDQDSETRITTACLLAAGTGSRLRPLTDSIPKCLTEINGRPILERLVSCLREQGFKRLVVVVGHLEQCIREFLDDHAGDLVVEYVRNPVYRTTNNIYSLWLAGSEIQESFLLIESDLIFESPLLEGLLIPDKIAVSRQRPWMNGTTIAMDASGHVRSFHGASSTSPRRSGRVAPLRDSTYKTVNICSLSSASWSRVLPRLERIIADGGVNEYYEVVFAEMVADGSLDFECVVFDADQWYEVDRLEDVPGAERMTRRIHRVSRPSLPVPLDATRART
ncbi:MAG: phosphocholine cytidylyltransferase family protein [Deltaproteobacteria bacterium]|nr:phosphocholine cytidylyltransferase family protein [Deltaproteobacteria bacterium]